MRIVVFTMVYNNAEMLPVWLRYYGAAVGVENLIVLDHGSDDGSIAMVPRGVSVLPLPRKEADDIVRTEAVNAFKNALLGYYDMVIYTDCDEIILPDPAVYPGGLREFCAAAPPITAPVGLDIFHVPELEPEPLDPRRPVLHQRRFCRFRSAFCKPVIVGAPVRWRVGFHFADRPADLARDVFLFHLKAVDRDMALRRLRLTRSLKWAQSNIDKDVSWHARIPDEQFEAREFGEPIRELEANRDRSFDFGADCDRLLASLKAGQYRYPFFTGKVAEIPERFRDCF